MTTVTIEKAEGSNWVVNVHDGDTLIRSWDAASRGIAEAYKQGVENGSIVPAPPRPAKKTPAKKKASK